MFPLEHYFNKTYYLRKEVFQPRTFKLSQVNDELSFKGEFSRAGKNQFLPDTTNEYYVYYAGRISDKLGRLDGYALGTWVSLEELNKNSTVSDISELVVYNDLGFLMNLETTYIYKGYSGEVLIAVQVIYINSVYRHGRASKFEPVTEKYTLKNRPCYLVSQQYNPLCNWSSDYTRIGNVAYNKNLKSNKLLYINGRLITPEATTSVIVSGTHCVDEISHQEDLDFYNATYNLKDLLTFTITTKKGDVDYYLVNIEDRSLGFITSYGFIFSLLSKDGLGFRLLNIRDGDFITLTESFIGVKISRVDELIQSHPELDEKAKLHLVAFHESKVGMFQRSDSKYRHVLESLPPDEAGRIICGVVKGPSCWSASSLYKDDFINNCFLSIRDYNNLDTLRAFGYTYTSNLLQPPTYLYPDDEQPTPDEYNKAGTLIQYTKGTSDVTLITSNLGLALNKKLLSNYYPQSLDYISTHYDKEKANKFDNKNVVSVDLRDTEYDFAYFDRNTSTLKHLTQDEIDSGAFVVIGQGKATWTLSPERFEFYTRPKSSFFGLACLTNEYNFEVSDFLGIYWGDVVKLPYKDAVVIYNKKRLVEGIDFIRTEKGLAICNKKYTTFESAPTTNFASLSILLTGAASDSSKFQKKEIGFIKHGVIGLSNKWELRQWRRASLHIDSKPHVIENFQLDPIFAENGKFDEDSRLNGLPFEYTENELLLRPTQKERIFPKELEEVSKQDLGYESEVIEYMRLHHSIVPPTSPSLFDKYHLLFSPFICEIIKDFINGQLNILPIDVKTYGLDALLSKYLYLLDLDPCVNDKYIDWDICTVDAHPYRQPLTVTANQYTVLGEINTQYLSGRVDLTKLLYVR